MNGEKWKDNRIHILIPRVVTIVAPICSQNAQESCMQFFGRTQIPFWFVMTVRFLYFCFAIFPCGCARSFRVCHHTDPHSSECLGQLPPTMRTMTVRALVTILLLPFAAAFVTKPAWLPTATSLKVKTTWRSSCHANIILIAA